MKDFRLIVLFAVGFAVLPWFTHSGVLLNALMMALFACLMSQSWNILGGFGGQSGKNASNTLFGVPSVPGQP